MFMLQAEIRKNAGSYTVYTYEPEDEPLEISRQKPTRYCWRRQLIIDEPEGALSAAQKLFNSGRYHKVEVKRRVFNSRKNCPEDYTIRVLEERHDPGAKVFLGFVLAFLGGAALACLGVLGI